MKQRLRRKGGNEGQRAERETGMRNCPVKMNEMC